MICRTTALVLFLFLLSGFSLGAAQAQTVQVTGRVMSATDQPVSGAEVHLQSVRGSASTATSDTSGRFEFSNVEPGEYRVSAKAIGLSPVAQVLTVTSGASLDLTLVLPEIVRERVNGEPNVR